MVFLLFYVSWRRPPDARIHGTTRTRSPFLVNSNAFIPPPFKLPDNMTPMPNPLSPKLRSHRVPNAVHIVYGFADDNGRGPEFPYSAYLSLRSSLLRLKPEKIFFHYHFEPEGPWWDAIRPHLTLQKVDIPTEIFGKEIDGFAHAADVVRLYAMQQSGGIYLDIDVFIVRDFDDLLSYPTTLGMEARPKQMIQPMDPTGLCNGIIIAEPNAPFINRWIDRYQDFDTDKWAYHSVELPWHLARQNPIEVQVLNHKAFFSPLWTADQVDDVFLGNSHNFYTSGQYAYHAWESISREYLEALSPASIRKQDTSFTRLVYPLMGPDDDKTYDEWVRWKRARDDTPT